MSKVLAEKQAWSLASEHGLDLVTILPEFIMGPVGTRAAADTSLSAGFMKARLRHVACFCCQTGTGYLPLLSERWADFSPPRVPRCSPHVGFHRGPGWEGSRRQLAHQ